MMGAKVQVNNEQCKPSVILVADRTLSSSYKILFEGIFATMQTTQVPEIAMRKLVSPPMAVDKHGRARSVALGLRRLEAALISQGVLTKDDLICTTPEGLDRLMGPWVKVVGVSSSDPLGRGMSNTTTKNFWKGELYTKVWTDRLMARLKKDKEKHGFKVIAGGAGAWQWVADPDEAERQGIDTVFDGYAESRGVEVIRDLLNNKETAPVEIEKSSVGDLITPIKGASLLGIVELSRGCGRGCNFCSISKKPMVHLPADTILSDIETNVSQGVTSVVSGSEDLFRYGATGAKVDFNKLRSLLIEMKKINGLSFMQIDHVNVTSVLQLSIEQLKEIRSLLTWKNKSEFLWVNMGVESASGKLVAANSSGKISPYDPDQWENMVRDAVSRLDCAGFFPVLSIIIGLPHETGEDLARTFRLVKDMAKKRAAVFPVFYEPLSRDEKPFTLKEMRSDHLELYAQCYEINFKWVPPMFWDNQRAGGVSWRRRALMRILGKTEIRTWRKTFSTLRKEMSMNKDPVITEAKITV